MNYNPQATWSCFASDLGAAGTPAIFLAPVPSCNVPVNSAIRQPVIACRELPVASAGVGLDLSPAGVTR